MLAAVEWSKGRGGKGQSEGGRSAKCDAGTSPEPNNLAGAKEGDERDRRGNEEEGQDGHFVLRSSDVAPCGIAKSSRRVAFENTPSGRVANSPKPL